MPTRATVPQFVRRWSAGIFTVASIAQLLLCNAPNHLLGGGLHAVHFHLEDAHDVPVVLLLLDLQRAFTDDFIGEIAHGFALRAVHHNLVLDLRRLPEAAGEE